MQVGTTKDQGLYNNPSAAVRAGALDAGTVPQYNTILKLLENSKNGALPRHTIFSILSLSLSLLRIGSETSLSNLHSGTASSCYSCNVTVTVF